MKPESLPPSRRALRAVILSYRRVSSSFAGVGQYFRETPTETPLMDVVSKSVTNMDAVLEHIDELRKHLLRASLVLLITTIFSFAFARQAIELLAAPIGGAEELIAIEVTEWMGVYMRVALLFGFTLALPYIAFEIWRFVAPGLMPKTRLLSLLFLPGVGLLFVMGMAFAYWVMLPTALEFLVNFMGMQTEVRPASYITFVTRILFWIGLVFEFPVVIFVLAGMGFIKARTLAQQWRIAVVVIAILAAAITPTVDPFSMALVMAPMIILYVFSIGLASIAQRNREKKSDSGVNVQT